MAAGAGIDEAGEEEEHGHFCAVGWLDDCKVGCCWFALDLVQIGCWILSGLGCWMEMLWVMDHDGYMLGVGGYVYKLMW